MAKKENDLTPTQFRLSAETLADMDAIAAWLGREQGRRQSRADALRYAVRQIAKKIRKKTE